MMLGVITSGFLWGIAFGLGAMLALYLLAVVLVRMDKRSF